MSIGEFFTKRFTQTFYRGGSKHQLSNPQSIDANISDIVIDDKNKKQFKNKIKQESRKVLGKLVDEENIDEIIQGPLLKKIFSKLGL
tara:strand:- start:2993 stop:3253 length:261 start_codon:yes stop_codon:yes gene_type:complete